MTEKPNLSVKPTIEYSDSHFRHFQSIADFFCFFVENRPATHRFLLISLLPVAISSSYLSTFTTWRRIRLIKVKSWAESSRFLKIPTDVAWTKRITDRPLGHKGGFVKTAGRNATKYEAVEGQQVAIIPVSLRE